MKTTLLTLLAFFSLNMATAQYGLVGISEEQINTLNLKLEKRNNDQLGDFLFFGDSTVKMSFILDTAHICQMIIVIPSDRKSLYNYLKVYNTSPDLIKAGDGVWKFIRKSTIITIAYLEEGEIAYFSIRETLD